MEQEEIWRDIEGYEGLYRVSNLGRVKSISYKRTGKERILKPLVSRDGYLSVHIRKDGKEKRMSIHRLVSQAFIPNPNGLPHVNHKNEVKCDNRVENLEWCTQSYNNNYGTRTERCSKPVLQLNLNGDVIKRWRSTHEAAREGGFNHRDISSCCLKREHYKTHKGYKWKYAEDYKTTSEALF